MIKAYVCRAAEWVTREALQIHGGMGYAEEFPVSRYFVDARVLSIFEGADETLGPQGRRPRGCWPGPRADLAAPAPGRPPPSWLASPASRSRPNGVLLQRAIDGEDDSNVDRRTGKADEHGAGQATPTQKSHVGLGPWLVDCRKGTVRNPLPGASAWGARHSAPAMATVHGARVPFARLAAVVLVLTGLGLAIATGPPAGAAGSWVPGNISTSGLSPAPSTAPTSAGLAGVSCPSTTSCIAVGSYTGQFGPQTGIPVNGYDGLIEVGTLTGGTWSWTATTAPTAGLVPPAQSLVTNNVALNSVSCGSPTSCVAGGSYHDDSNGDHGLIETGTLTGTTWSWTATTAPTTGLSPPPPTTPVEYVWGTSCSSATTCVLAGDYRDTGGATDGLIETGTLSGSTWTWVASSLPTADLSPPPPPRPM